MAGPTNEPSGLGMRAGFRPMWLTRHRPSGVGRAMASGVPRVKHEEPAAAGIRPEIGVKPGVFGHRAVNALRCPARADATPGHRHGSKGVFCPRRCDPVPQLSRRSMPGRCLGRSGPENRRPNAADPPGAATRRLNPPPAARNQPTCNPTAARRREARPCQAAARKPND